MKSTVYVPDDLWAEALAAQPAANPSQVVQAGLRVLIHTPRELGYATKPPDQIMADFETAVVRLREEARSEFAHGYRQAVNVAQVIPWFLVEELVDTFHFDVKRWVADDLRCRIERSDGTRYEVPEGTEWARAVDAIDLAFGSIPIGGSGSSLEVPSTAFADGFRQAMQDLWDSIRRPQGATSSDVSACQRTDAY